MKRIFKSLVAMALALALTFTFAPVSAQAAGFKPRVGSVGGTYKLNVTLPGNVKVKPNVTIADHASQTYADGSVLTVVKFHVDYPKKQKNIIKNNTSRILKSCPVKKTSGWTKTVYGPVDLDFGVYDASGKKAQQNPYLAYKGGMSGTAIYTNFRQNRDRLSNFYTSYDVVYIVGNAPAVNGNVYIGVAGASKAVTSNNKKYKKLVNGSGTLPKAGFCTNKKSGVFVVG